MKILSLLVLLMFANNVWAQDGKWQLGVNGGVGFSRIIDAQGSATSKKPTTGVLGGITSRYQFARRWRMEAQLQYIEKGLDGITQVRDIDAASGYTDRGFNSNFKLDYVTLPVQVQFVVGGKLRASFGAGGYVGYLLKSDGNRQTFFGAYDFNNPNRDKQRFYEFDAGLSASSGVEYSLTPKLVLGLSYQLQHGFVQTFKNVQTPGSQYNLTHAAVMTLTRKI